MAELRFTKEHEWTRVEGDICVCGISDYAQKSLGDVVYVELPAVGRQVNQGDQIAVVESAKAASEVYAPVTGEVIAVNDTLTSKPGNVNISAMGDGWFFKIRSSEKIPGQELLTEAAYQNYLKGLNT